VEREFGRAQATNSPSCEAVPLLLTAALRPLRRRIRTASFVHELLSRRYGVKSIVDKMCWELYQTIQKLRMEDKELDIFGAAALPPTLTPTQTFVVNPCDADVPHGVFQGGFWMSSSTAMT